MSAAYLQPWNGSVSIVNFTRLCLFYQVLCPPRFSLLTLRLHSAASYPSKALQQVNLQCGNDEFNSSVLESRFCSSVFCNSSGRADNYSISAEPSLYRQVNGSWTWTEHCSGGACVRKFSTSVSTGFCHTAGEDNSLATVAIVVFILLATAVLIGVHCARKRCSKHIVMIEPPLQQARPGIVSHKQWNRFSKKSSKRFNEFLQNC